MATFFLWGGGRHTNVQNLYPLQDYALLQTHLPIHLVKEVNICMYLVLVRLKKTNGPIIPMKPAWKRTQQPFLYSHLY